MIRNAARGIVYICFVFAVIAAMFTGTAFAAEATVQLSLEEAISIALEQSFAIKSLMLSLSQAEQGYLSAKRRYWTNMDLSLSLPQWNERISEVQVANALPVYNSRGTLRYRGRLNINQPLPTGGTFSLVSDGYQSEESNYFVDTDTTVKRKDFVSTVGLRFNQPLFTYNRLKNSLDRAELNYETRSLSYSRGELDVIYSVTSSFFSLYRSTRSWEIAKESLAQQEEQYNLAKLKFEAGLIPEVESLRTEVNLASAQSRVMDAESAMESQREAFKQTLGLPLTDNIGVRPDIDYVHFEVDLDKAVQLGLSNRTEIREQEISITLSEMSVIETDARSEVRADLSASYDFSGYSNQKLPLSTSPVDLFNSSWDDLTRRPGNRGVTLTVSLPVWDWGVNKAEVASARAGLKRSQLQLDEVKKDIVLSVTDAVRQLRSAENSLIVLQKSQEVAERMYDISLERFNNGEITSLELADDQQNLSNAKMSFLGAYISYKLAVADLKRKTRYDFELNVPLQ